MKKKVVIFAMNGELIYFAHAMLNGLNMRERGIDARIVIEAGACRLVSLLEDTDKPFADLFSQIKETGMIEGVCRSCAEQLNVMQSIRDQGLAILDEMHGHPSMARYIEAGYEVITF